MIVEVHHTAAAKFAWLKMETWQIAMHFTKLSDQCEILLQTNEQTLCDWSSVDWKTIKQCCEKV